MCSTRQRLAAVLREHRVSLGLTLRQAAEKAALAPSTLSRWESGACLPRVVELESLLRTFDVSEERIRGILISIDAPRTVRAARGNDVASKEHLLAPSGGTLLRALRCRTKQSVSAVAERLGVSPSSLSRWESGRSRPAPETLDSLLDLLGASDEVRRCLAASGIAKLKVERPPYDRAALARELDFIESRSFVAAEDRDLRLLQLQSLLWWFREEPGAMDLLQQSILCYGELLCGEARYAEAAAQAQSVLDAAGDPLIEVTIRATRILARAEVFRWPAPRPHIGLYLLQRCLNLCGDSLAGRGVLQDMVEYSLLAGLVADARHYAERAEGRFLAKPSDLLASVNGR